MRAPVHRVLVADHPEARLVRAASLIEAIPIGFGHRRRLSLAQDTPLDERLFVERPRGGVSPDGLVHEGLGRRRLVGLVVTQPPITDQIDYHVLVESLPITKRDSHCGNRRFGIVAVNVEHGRFHHLRDVRAIGCGAAVAKVAGREPDLVVDDDMNRPTGVKLPGLGQLEGLRHHTLPCYRGIPVDEHRHDLIPFGIPPAILPGAHGTLDHRIDDFQV